MVHPNQDPQDAALNLSARLRTETRAEHERVESLPFSRAIIDRSVTLERYVAQLHAWYAMLTELELAVGADPTLRDACQGWTHRSEWIEQDLEHLDPQRHHVSQPAQQAVARMIAWLADGDLTTRLGALYVIEGSAMGGLVLRGHLAHALNLQDHGLRYHAGHGPQSAPRWLALKQRLDAIPLSPQDQDRAVAAANAAFSHIGEILAAL